MVSCASTGALLRSCSTGACLRGVSRLLLRHPLASLSLGVCVCVFYTY
nr:MAG TPA: hypothetical protein [Caudoviricetes sp.]